MKENKIVYCYDEFNNFIYYNDAIKGNIYKCVDCGAELIVKDGDIKTKHLAHKSGLSCGGSGETIFHKHWKENLFRKGLFITVSYEPYEIINVYTEVSLMKRYNKEWDRDIIVDVLLETTGGDVVVEVNYSNKKVWLELEEYYSQIPFLQVFEVTVSREINSELTWSTMGECLKNERKLLKQKIEKILTAKEEQAKLNRINSKHEALVIYNYKTWQGVTIEEDGVLKILDAMVKTSDNKLKVMRLVIDSSKYKVENFELAASKGIMGKKISIIGYDENDTSKQTVWITGYEDDCIEQAYNKELYKKICDLACKDIKVTKKIKDTKFELLF